MATKRAWGDKTGSGGDPNVLKLEDSTKIRLIDPAGKIEYKQHVVEHVEDSDQSVFIVCPDDGNCPMCRKPEGPDGERYFPRSRRFATNVWDYATNSVKVLLAGPQIFNKFDDAAEVGYDPTASDWTIHKSGSKKQTEYNTIRGDASPFEGEVGPDDLHDTDKYTQPSSVEQILEEIEKQGYDYDALETRQFTEDTALAYVFPYGKMKGSTVEQVLATDQQYAEYMYNSKKNQGAYGDPLFLALHTVLEVRGEVEALPELDRSAGPPPKANPESITESSSSSSGIMVEMVSGDQSVKVPKDQVAGLESAGFEKVVVPEPESDTTGQVELNTPDGEATIWVDPDQVKGLEDVGFTAVEAESEESGESEVKYPVVLVKDGNELSAPDEDTRTALESSGFVPRDSVTQTPTEEPEPEPIPDDLKVTAKIGDASVPMLFGAVVTAAEGGTDISIADNDEAQTELEKRLGGPPGSSFVNDATDKLHKDANSEANGGTPMESADHADPEKPFNCEFCDKAYKTKGALTQHKNKEHKDAKPATTASSNGGGGGDREALMEEVKALIDKVPDLQKDYDKLLDLFKEVAGKRAISEFTEEELGKLKAKLTELAG